jgi:plasmid maintenance system antidote protein VapI
MKTVALISKRSKDQLAVVSKKLRPLRKSITKFGATLGIATNRARRLIEKNPLLAAVGATALMMAFGKLRRSL